ncbi:MAG: hypothetical protein ABJD97_08540 [Betaproteobacteria bacterium]
MNEQTHELFTREDGEKCKVLVTEVDVPGRAGSVRDYFLDDPRELLHADNLNQGWYIASESGLRYQR